MNPTRNNVLLRRTEEEPKKGEILLPDSVKQDKTCRGKILKIGPEVTSVKIGQEVVFEKHSEVEVEMDKETLLIVEEKYLIAIL